PGRFVARFTATVGGVTGPERWVAFEIAPEQDAPEVLGPLSWVVRAGETVVFPVNTTGEPESFWVSGLPEGLTFHQETRQIHGVTTQVGTYWVQLQPSRADVAGEIFEMELRVEGAAAAPILIGVEELRATV